MDPVIKEGTSAAEHMEIEPTSAASEHTEIEPTSATAEHTGIEPTSAAVEHIESGERMQIEGTISAAAETTESGEKMQIERPTSAEAEPTESRERTYWPKNSIFPAAAHIRFGRESNFEPKLVSIGPYHHGRENLKHMEDFKLRCVKELLQCEKFLATNHCRPLEADIPPHRNRSIYNVPVEPSMQGERGIDDVSFKQFDDLVLNEFMDSGKIARAYYKQEFKYSDDEFVRMLVIDSLFIIRVVLSLSQQVQESMGFLDVHIKDVRSDLLMLENQIPLFFIKEVYLWFCSLMRAKELPPFEIVLEPFICLDMPWRINNDDTSRRAVHLLDFYWRCSLSPRMCMKLSELEEYLRRDISEQIEQERSHSFDHKRNHSEQEQPSWAEIHLSFNAPMMIPNVTELQNMAGIEFEKFKDKGHLDVIFSGGVMRMPRLKIDTRQTTLLVNVIAFENCILPTWRIFSCYMKLMDTLIDSEQDVQLLQKCGVIYNTLSSHEMAATFFNDIGNFCFIDNNTNPFSGLYKDVQKYYHSSWHRRWASLRQNYFNSPWAGISVVAGVTLLIFSALQTFYTINGYYKLKN